MSMRLKNIMYLYFKDLDQIALAILLFLIGSINWPLIYGGVEIFSLSWLFLYARDPQGESVMALLHIFQSVNTGIG